MSKASRKPAENPSRSDSPDTSLWLRLASTPAYCIAPIPTRRGSEPKFRRAVIDEPTTW